MRMTKRRKAPAPESFTVSFRVGAAHHAMLAAGAERTGGSVHAFARDLVLDALDDAERGAVLEEVQRLAGALEDHRSEVRRAVLALLVYAGGQKDEEARRWVREHLVEYPEGT